ncbi:Oidioi.mRNA.OKI2018_I69.PAR.g10767.t1.cds [Oikopleura dioica]|uniref:Oidioi.mRNA.OKI2018_I69.PAR.g10767.t1.cds n=1 Tax=Oikopleura dioica TaxID=34765 RepID=A0ABN7RVQ4_OIKDI|nr:Oidioi.mRNA.OKI2018_I69.PAR.g10767.t1.cds [Oikopleura dioica]
MGIKIPVVVRTNDELTLTQYVGRQRDRRVDHGNVRIKPETRVLEVTEQLTNSGPNIDEDRAEMMAETIDGPEDSSLRTNADNKYFSSKKYDHIRLKGSETATKGYYLAGVVKNGRLVLFPVRTTFQLRPSLGYMDRAVKMIDNKDGDSSDDESSSTQKIRVRINRTETASSHAPVKTFTSHKREVEEEAWKNLAVYPVETLNESYDASEAHVKNQEYAPIEAYLENMSHKETKKDSEYDRALRDKLMEYLWDGQAASYSHLKAKFGDYSEEDLNDNLKILCWAVRGYFTLKGCIRYQRDQRSDMARDKVISALNELLAPNVQIPVTKRDTVAKLAKTEDDNSSSFTPKTDPDRLVGSNSAGIFAGPAESDAEIDRRRKSIIRFLENKEPPIGRKRDLMSALGLQSIDDVATTMVDGSALVAFPHSIAFCERKEDAFILQTMAEMVQAQGKFRRAAVFAITQKTDLPIDTKSFDQTLRRFCYSAGQFWNGSKFETGR